MNTMLRFYTYSSIILLMAFSMTTEAQKYFTDEGTVHFYSSTPLKNIEAVNNHATAIFDKSNGRIKVQLRIQKFDFPNETMEDHFNERYMESETYPKASFDGKILNYDPQNYTPGTSHKINVKGQLQIHGVTNEVTKTGTVKITQDSIKTKSTFHVKLKDYDIEIPKVVTKKIAEEIKVTVNFVLSPLNE